MVAFETHVRASVWCAIPGRRLNAAAVDGAPVLVRLPPPRGTSELVWLGAPPFAIAAAIAGNKTSPVVADLDWFHVPSLCLGQATPGHLANARRTHRSYHTSPLEPSRELLKQKAPGTCVPLEVMQGAIQHS